MRSLLKTIFVADPGFRATLDQIKSHAVFKRIDWDEAKDCQLEAPWVPDENMAYHNCNEKAQVSSRGVLPDKVDLAKLVFQGIHNTNGGPGPNFDTSVQPNSSPDFTVGAAAGINDNQFVRLQKEKAMQAVMNADMPMAKGIVDDAFMEKNRVVAKRKQANPLGNFWTQNLDQIFKDF